MSKPRYDWYGNVIRIIRYYPKLAMAKADLQKQSTISNYSGMPKLKNISRTTETLASKQLSEKEEEEYWAVYHAIEDIKQLNIGKEILEVVELYHWRGVRNFDTVGYMSNMSESKAKRYNSKFVYTVAKKLKYLKVDLTEPKK